MKKLFMLLIITFTMFIGSTKMVFAENISYPFDTIVITEAFKFDVLIPNDIAEASLLFGLVTSGEVITVYVGTIEMTMTDIANTSTSQIVILTNALDEDIIQFIINNYSFYPDVSVKYGFASHILIDPVVGVFKDLDALMASGLKEIEVFHDLPTDTYALKDNVGQVMPMIQGTFATETGLNIIISVNEG